MTWGSFKKAMEGTKKGAMFQKQPEKRVNFVRPDDMDRMVGGMRPMGGGMRPMGGMGGGMQIPRVMPRR